MSAAGERILKPVTIPEKNIGEYVRFPEKTPANDPENDGEIPEGRTPVVGTPLMVPEK
jgi:hypothetical protein